MVIRLFYINTPLFAHYAIKMFKIKSTQYAKNAKITDMSPKPYQCSLKATTRMFRKKIDKKFESLKFLFLWELKPSRQILKVFFLALERAQLGWKVFWKPLNRLFVFEFEKLLAKFWQMAPSCVWTLNFEMVGIYLFAFSDYKIHKFHFAIIYKML